MAKFAVLILGFFVTTSAFATGGYTCSVDDANIKFELSGTLSHGIPGLPWDEVGSLNFKDATLSEYAIPAIAKSSQFWLEDNELRILVYDEPQTQDFKSVKLVIKTQYEDETGYTGTYQIGLYNGVLPVNLSGAISCDLE